jgi:hypothetical protein
MRNKAILFSLILVATGSALAEKSLLEGVAKQAVENKAAEVAPDAIEKVDTANQTLNKAKALKGATEMAPDELQDQAKDKAAAVVPAEAKKTGETVGHLKGKVDTEPKSTKVIKSKAKDKAAEKALELVH